MQNDAVSAWQTVVTPLYKKAYLDLFGLTPTHAAYFDDKDIVRGTPLNLFDDVIRSAVLHYAAPRTDVVLTSLRIAFGGIDLIYGYIHSFGDDLEPQFYDIAGSLISQDGEYRKDLVPTRQYNVAVAAFGQFFDIVLPHINSLIETNTIKITYDHFPSDKKPTLGVFPTYVLAVAWYIDYFMTDIGVLDKHLYGMRKDMIANFPGAPELYAKIRSLKGFSMNDFIAVTKYPDSRPISFNCGQKLIPMLRKDVANPFDITQQLWRELYINEEVSLLMMNNIALGFAFTAGWYYIRGVDERAFDNPAMKDKYANSAVANKINMELTDAIGLTNKEMAKYPTDDPRHDIQTPIDDTFGELRNDILEDVGFLNSHLRLSDVAICMLSVHTNVTIGNFWLLAKILPSIPMLEVPIFSRIVFDIFYSLYCLNERVGAMHADLHINNATVMRLLIRDNVKFANTAYVLPSTDGSNEPAFYSHRYDGMIGCVIDFSRCIIGDMKKIAHSYGIVTAGQLRVMQVEPLLRLIRRYFPEHMEKSRRKIEALADDNFERFFRVCTIIDAYSLTTGLHTMLETDDRYAAVKPDLKKWVRDAAAACEEIFDAELTAALNDAAPPTPHLPMRELIRRVYDTTARIQWPPTGDPVGHVINSMNPLKWGISTPEEWNPLVHPKIALDACVNIPGRDCSNYISDNWDWVAARREGDIARVRAIGEEYKGGNEGEDMFLTEPYGYNDPAPFAAVI